MPRLYGRRFGIRESVSAEKKHRQECLCHMSQVLARISSWLEEPALTVGENSLKRLGRGRIFGVSPLRA
jgi:hypothetical protein